MKQFRLLSCAFVAVLCLSFTSCSDSNPIFATADFIGRWVVTDIEGYVQDENGKVTVDQKYTEEEWIFYFNTEGKGYERDFDNDLYEFDWTVKKGDRLILTGEDFQRSLTILSMDKTLAIIEEKQKTEKGEVYTKYTLRNYDVVIEE